MTDTPMPGLTLVTGGARSGKSNYAERLARAQEKPVLYVATAEPLDEEMRERIQAHQLARPSSWQTLEAPFDVAAQLARTPTDGKLILMDCLTLLVSNVLLAERSVENEVESLIAWHQGAGCSLIVVTNEVGFGIVPDNPLARQYRDALGKANQRLATEALAVILMIAGIPVKVK